MNISMFSRPRNSKPHILIFNFDSTFIAATTYFFRALKGRSCLKSRLGFVQHGGGFAVLDYLCLHLLFPLPQWLLLQRDPRVIGLRRSNGNCTSDGATAVSASSSDVCGKGLLRCRFRQACFHMRCLIASCSVLGSACTMT